MTTAVLTPSGDLLTLIEEVAPKRFSYDFLGLLSGYRAYQVYTHLRAMSDAELAALGVRRHDLARLAMETVFDGRRTG